MKPKNIYDHHRKHIGTVKYLKNKNEYGFEFQDDNHYANTLVSVDGLDEYMNSFGFMYEEDLKQITLEDLL